jgi:L-histidine Nalpha-methyltransferase
MTSSILLLDQFALNVAEGLSQQGQKKLPPRYFYDDLGSSLFEAITLLPEYGLTRADERLLRRHAADIAAATGSLEIVAELGSGSGKKTEHVLRACSQHNPSLLYCPIDVSSAALAVCERELGSLFQVHILTGDWSEGLSNVAHLRQTAHPLLLLFLGSSIGNLDRDGIAPFLQDLRADLQSGDYFLLGADLVKDVNTILAAYDDATGVTAAFNRNVLGRINRELDGKFDLSAFKHEARWNSGERRIEMHLTSLVSQTVEIGVLEKSFHFEAGETIWTESSHKFSLEELDSYADLSGFLPVATWTDREWPFAEALWQAA